MRLETFLCIFIVLAKVGQGLLEEIPSVAFTLDQVVILSRHGLRTPLSKYLTQMTPRTWPQWRERPGYLTEKGADLEGYMGHFFSLWLNEHNLITQKCPTKDKFYIYANTKQRTLASAKAFTSSAFPGCNITIHHSKTVIDPIFNPVIHNTSSIFRQIVIADMQKTLRSLSVNSSYIYLENILDYQNSKCCKTQNKCDLVTDKNKVIVISGDKPNLSGPLKIGNSVIDAFIMEYYEGFPLENVAWDFIHSPKDWKNVMKLSHSYHNVIFNTPLVARDISKPLLNFLKSIFINKNAPKVSLLMGHDANIYTVMEALRFKPYILKKQYDLVPISGKIVFQKWHDNLKNVDLLKVDYVYQSSRQLRFAIKLDMQNPPQFEPMVLEDCKIDDNGLCLWEQFEKILESL